MANILQPVVIGGMGMKTPRITRSPDNKFYVKTKPFALTPCYFHPVIPSETLTKTLFQTRSVTENPIASDLLGWHHHFWQFYVPMRSLSVFSNFATMVEDVDGSLSGLDEATDDTKYNCAAGGVNWGKYCMEAVVKEFFRFEDETWDANTIYGYPAMRASTANFMDSLILAADYAGAFEVDIDEDADGTITTSEVNSSFIKWHQMVARGDTTMDYETFLRQYGVDQKPEVTHKPEMLRYIRQFVNPTRLTDTDTGVPVAHLQTKIASSAVKKARFKEPGFLFGVTAFTPKWYSSTQTGSAAGFMKNLRHWMPATALARPHIGVTEFAAGAGPFGGSTASYVFDVADLFTKGEQFSNATEDYNWPIPSNDMTNKSYMTETQVDLLAPGGNECLIKTDGIAKMFIKGPIHDQTMPTE